MARPNYIIEKDGEQRTVPSLEMQELIKHGWVNLGKADTVKAPNTNTTEPKPEPKAGDITPQFTPKVENEVLEVEKQEHENIETSKPEVIQTKTDSDGLPDDLVCPHCNAKARTKKSYTKNHGDNCLRKK